MPRTLIRCGWIVTMDDGLGELTNAEILIEDTKIVAVGKNLGSADTVIEAGELIAIPGLIDAHLHAWETGLKGLASNWGSGEYLRRIFGGMATRFNAEDNYLATLAAALSRIDCGVTTLLDYAHNIRTTEQADGSLDALEESGMRAVFALANGVSTPEEEKTDPLERRLHPRERVAHCRDRLSGDDRLVTMSLAIAGPHWARAEAIRANLAIARDFGLRTTSHATKRPEMTLMPNGYVTLIEEGLLGPEHNIVHGNFLSDDELKRMVDAGFSATCTVQTEIRGYARPPLVSRLIKLGSVPSLGIDVEPTVPGDMFREMQLALTFARHEQALAKEAGSQPSVGGQPIHSREALRWATMGGAIALGLDSRVGSLTPGKRADIVLLRARDLNMAPVHDPVAAAVEFAHSGNVDTVLIDGKVMKRGGKLSKSEREIAKLRLQLVEATARIMHEAEQIEWTGQVA